MRSIVTLAVLLAAAAPARAQEVASSMNQLRVLVRPGERVEVTKVGGEKTKATVESISNAGLDLWVRGTLLKMPEAEVAQIRARRPPDVGKGARNGFIIGALFGILPGLVLGDEAPDQIALIAISSAVYGGIGAGIGAGISAMIPNQCVVYDVRARPSASGVRVAPIVSRERKGVAVSLGF